MTLTTDKQDKIHNALLVGIALEDAYIYAGLTAQEIEAVAEDTDYFTLRNESLGVDSLYDAEDKRTFPASSQHHQHLMILLSVPTLTVKHGNAAPCLGYLGSNFIIFFGEDKELYRLPVAVHYVVNHHDFYEQRAVAVDQ